MTRYELIKFAMRYGNKPASREYKTTAKTVRKWVKRYQEKGLSGLYDKSRRPKTSPNKCSKRVEKEIVALRKKTKHRYGAKRLIERFDLPVGKSCVQRIIKDHNLTRKPKTKKQKRNCLWSIKKLMSVFEKIQIDVKELTDIPLYVSSYYKNNIRKQSDKLPKYEFTARCVKTGASFVCFARRNTGLNAAIFAVYLIEHLKENGFDVTTIEFQTDNGPEFNACGNKQTGNTPFEVIIRDIYLSTLSFIPPASPTFNSDIETFHRLVEDEFYAIEPISNYTDLIAKMMTYLTEFNFIRTNSYKDNKSPIALALDENKNFNKSLFSLTPILLDDHSHLYFNHIKPGLPQCTKKLNKTDPFLDHSFRSNLEKWNPNFFRLQNALRGDYVSSLDTITLGIMKLIYLFIR